MLQARLNMCALVPAYKRGYHCGKTRIVGPKAFFVCPIGYLIHVTRTTFSFSSALILCLFLAACALIGLASPWFLGLSFKILTKIGFY